MQRREFLKNNAALLSALPLASIYIDKCMETPGDLNTEIFKFNLGKFKCTIFQDLMFKYHAKDFFINADKEELDQSLVKFKITPDNIPSPFIAFLLQHKKKKILIDTGIGYSEEPISFKDKSFVFKGRFTQLLQEDGINKEDITDVVISHFHPDHVGGVFSGNGKLNFPNAQFHMHEDEWNYWHSSKSDGESPLFKIFIEKNITPLKDLNLNLIKGDFHEIIPGITSVKAEGHTPGQIALIVKQAKNHLLYISDAFLHPLHIEKIDWQTSYDLDHAKAKQTRIKLLDLAQSEDMLFHAFHFDFPGLGRVDKLKNTWVWNYSNA